MEVAPGRRSELVIRETAKGMDMPTQLLLTEPSRQEGEIGV